MVEEAVPPLEDEDGDWTNIDKAAGHRQHEDREAEDTFHRDPKEGHGPFSHFHCLAK